MRILNKKLLHAWLITAFFYTGYEFQFSNASGTALPTQFGYRASNVYFGMHIHNLVLDLEQSNTTVTPWPEKKIISSIRLWDTRTRWAEIEPRPNEWHFDRMDNIVAQAMSHNHL